MACGAILRGSFLAMAREAGAHVVVHVFGGGGGLRHVAVAGDALDFGLDVRRVFELHVGMLLESVDAIPGDFYAFGGVVGEFLDFGLVRGDLRVAEHALLHGGDRRGGADIGHAVAIEAGEAEGDVGFVRVSDGLLRRLGGGEDCLRERDGGDQ